MTILYKTDRLLVLIISFFRRQFVAEEHRVHPLNDIVQCPSALPIISAGLIALIKVYRETQRDMLIPCCCDLKAMFSHN